MPPKEVEDAACEIDLRVQIVSRPPDQNPNTIPARRLVQVGRRITAVSQFPGAVFPRCDTARE
jgi:hypothetical protein